MNVGRTVYEVQEDSAGKLNNVPPHHSVNWTHKCYNRQMCKNVPECRKEGMTNFSFVKVRNNKCSLEGSATYMCISIGLWVCVNLRVQVTCFVRAGQLYNGQHKQTESFQSTRGEPAAPWIHSTQLQQSDRKVYNKDTTATAWKKHTHTKNIKHNCRSSAGILRVFFSRVCA